MTLLTDTGCGEPVLSPPGFPKPRFLPPQRQSWRGTVPGHQTLSLNVGRQDRGTLGKLAVACDPHKDAWSLDGGENPLRALAMQSGLSDGAQPHGPQPSSLGQ